MMSVSILERIANVLIAIAEILLSRLKEREVNKDQASASVVDPDLIQFG